MDSERDRLIAAYRDAVRAENYCPVDDVVLCREVERAWEALCDWKHEHNECLHPECSTVDLTYSYCEAHR